MNIYLVVSEELTEYFHDIMEPPERYRIAELVKARNASQAKYLAWKSDSDSFTGDIRDMPRFQVRLKMADRTGKPGVIMGDDPDLHWMWE